MKIEIWWVGKTQNSYLAEGIEIFERRLRHYLPISLLTLAGVSGKGMSTIQLKEKEGEMVLKRLKPGDSLILLDERGKIFPSTKFASFIERQLNRSCRRIIFLIGGAYGFSKPVYQKADGMISLSKMTFSHQMARLIFLEQLYRAMTILRNEPYHNE